jgi:hypothetical protein
MLRPNLNKSGTEVASRSRKEGGPKLTNSRSKDGDNLPASGVGVITQRIKSGGGCVLESALKSGIASGGGSYSGNVNGAAIKCNAGILSMPQSHLATWGEEEESGNTRSVTPKRKPFGYGAKPANRKEVV